MTALGGSASFTDFQTALEHVRFVNPGDPTGGGTDPTRTLTWTVVDTNQTAINTGSSTSTINGAQPPVVTAGANVTFTEGSGPVLADSTLALSDSNSIKSATVAITGGFLAGETRSTSITAPRTSRPSRTATARPARSARRSTRRAASSP